MSYILDALKKADAQRVRDPARGIHAQATLAMPASGDRERRRNHLLWSALAVLGVAAAAGLWLGRKDPEVVPVAITAPPAATPRLTPSPATVTTVLQAPAAVAIAPPAPVEVRQPPVVAMKREAPPVAVLPAPAAPASTDRTYNFAELPSDVQQAWPKFAISGGVHSENVAQRMLIVNGQVFNEGSEIAPGVVLEQVRPKTALLKFRGLRISQPY